MVTQETSHFLYMKKALAQARHAYARDEVPIGAIIVNQEGTIIARAYNIVEQSCSQTAHAELRAIEKAGKKLGDWRLEKCYLYVTVKPCAMCMNAIILARMAGIIFGADSPLFGYDNIDKTTPSWLYKKDTLAIIGGICQEEAIMLLQTFFKDKRK